MSNVLLPGLLLPGYWVIEPFGGLADKRLLFVKLVVLGVTGIEHQGPLHASPIVTAPLNDESGTCPGGNVSGMFKVLPLPF